MEWQAATCAAFITLTFSPETVPSPAEFTLRPLQLFMKRLRKTGALIRHFSIGEFGSLTNRPHYHSLVYGWAPPTTGRISVREWPAGHVFAGSVTPASVRYVMGYLKHDARKGPPPLHCNSIEFGKRGLLKIGFDAARRGEVWPDVPLTVSYSGKQFPLTGSTQKWLSEGYVLGGGTLPTQLSSLQRQKLSVLNHMWRHDPYETVQVETAFGKLARGESEAEFSRNRVSASRS